VFVAVVAVSAAFASGSAAATHTGAASGFYEARVLEPAASYVARKPVKVWCATTAAAWQRLAVDRSDVHGLTAPGTASTHLDTTVCGNLRARLLGGGLDNPSLAPSIEVLTHESIHMRGESNEGITDCAAVHEMPRVAVVYFSVKPGAQLRALMAAAWSWRRELAPAYRTVC
jgi:hypothetical protein